MRRTWGILGALAVILAGDAGAGIVGVRVTLAVPATYSGAGCTFGVAAIPAAKRVHVMFATADSLDKSGHRSWFDGGNWRPGDTLSAVLACGAGRFQVGWQASTDGVIWSCWTPVVLTGEAQSVGFGFSGNRLVDTARFQNWYAKCGVVLYPK